jgi:HPr kinase/phosphorylase
MFVHATCVALKAGRSWRALLLRGPSGAGKSDLALRLIENGWRLVADDQTHLARSGRALLATAPGSLAGLIEARGIGIARLDRTQLQARGRLALLVDLVRPDQVERLPDPAREVLLGVELPKIALAPFEASTVAKLRLALARTAAA